MKLSRLLLFCVLALGLTRSARAQGDSLLVASVIAGGGVAGGTCLEGATIGQWGAIFASGNPTIPTGFWNADPFPGLRLEHAGGSVLIAWPVSFPGFQLEQSTMVGTGAVWVSVPQSVTTANGENQVVVAIVTTARFYRLRQP